MAKSNEENVIKMDREKECKGSIRFATSNEDAVVSNVYVSRTMKGIEDAKSITVTVAVS